MRGRDHEVERAAKRREQQVAGLASERTLLVAGRLWSLLGSPDVLDDAVSRFLGGGRREVDVDGDAGGEHQAEGGETCGNPAQHGMHVSLRS